LICHSQTEGKTFSSSATQTDKEEVEVESPTTSPTQLQAPSVSKTISWRNQTNQILPVSVKKAETVLKNLPAVPVGTGIASNNNANAAGDAKPKTMITKTNPRPPVVGVWQVCFPLSSPSLLIPLSLLLCYLFLTYLQQVTPSISATKRPMIIPCDSWSIEVPGIFIFLFFYFNFFYFNFIIIYLLC
jgi:hypothetical protein